MFFYQIFLFIIIIKSDGENMNVGKIAYKQSKINFCANGENKDKKIQKTMWEELGIKEPSPIVQGFGSAALWFGFGYGTDRLLGKCFKMFQTDKKLSLKINGALGLCMGLYTGIKAGLIKAAKAKENKKV